MLIDVDKRLKQYTSVGCCCLSGIMFINIYKHLNTFIGVFYYLNTFINVYIHLLTLNICNHVLLLVTIVLIA